MPYCCIIFVMFLFSLSLEHTNDMFCTVGAGSAHLENILTDVIVVQPAVAKGDVYVKCCVVFVLDKDPLVNVRGLLKMTSSEVDGSQAELILCASRKVAMILQQLILIPHSVDVVE